MTSEDHGVSSVDLFTSWTKLGVKKAVKAMSEFMMAPVVCSEQAIIFTRIDELIRFVQQKNEKPAVCMLQGISGSVEGFFLFSASTNLVSALTTTLNNNLLMGDSLQVPEFALGQSMVNEWVNIFSGNVISSLRAPEIGTIEMTSTEQTFDMSGAALDFIACQMGVETDLIAVCHSRIQVVGTNEQMDVWIIINPNSQLFDLSEVKIKINP